MLIVYGCRPCVCVTVLSVVDPDVSRLSAALSFSPSFSSRLVFAFPLFDHFLLNSDTRPHKVVQGVSSSSTKCMLWTARDQNMGLILSRVTENYSNL